jgi:hypothetical protein
MRLFRAIPPLLAIAMAGCAAYHRPLASASVESALPRVWFLVAAPFSREFPRGNIEEPLSSWSMVTTYDTDGACDASLFEAENQLQRPVQCVASDDPRLAKN